MRLVLRCDDFGYTDIFNLGTKKVLRDGIVTHMEIMPDTPGSVDAMETMRQYPWITTGYHNHAWGRPSCDPKDIPSMVDENGTFKMRHEMFAPKKWRQEELPTYEDCYKEYSAQMEKYIEHLGRVPDFGGGRKNAPTAQGRAAYDVMKAYGVKMGAYAKEDLYQKGVIVGPDEEYRDSPLYMPGQVLSVYAPRYLEDSRVRNCGYDPLKYFLEDEDHLLDMDCAMVAFHPGYIDDYMYQDCMYWYKYDHAYFDGSMLKDILALCSREFREWIRDNKVELVNMHDAVFGTSIYQHHLKKINSDLWIGKLK